MKKIEDSNTHFHCGRHGQQVPDQTAVKKLCDIDIAKVNTLLRPDGEKRAYIWLVHNYDALDVTNKIGIIYTEFIG